MAKPKSAHIAIGALIIAVFLAAISLFNYGRSRALSAIPPTVAADVINARWGSVHITPESLQFKSADFSGETTSIIFVASLSDQNLKFRLSREGTAEIRLLQVIKTDPFAQDAVIWDERSAE